MNRLPGFFALELFFTFLLQVKFVFAALCDFIDDFQFLFRTDDRLPAEFPLLPDDTAVMFDLHDVSREAAGVITARGGAVDIDGPEFGARADFGELLIAKRLQFVLSLVESPGFPHDVTEKLFAQFEPVAANLANGFEGKDVGGHDACFSLIEVLIGVHADVNSDCLFRSFRAWDMTT